MKATHDVRLGLWGATLSGKTTYLAALRLATLNQKHGTWRVRPTDDASSWFLTDNTNLLYYDQVFPAATQDVKEPYSWRIEGQPSDLFEQFLTLFRYGSRHVSFRLEVIDCPGSFFDDTSAPGQEDLRRVVDHLVRADGLLYLFDPTRLGDSYRYFQRMLDRVTIESERQGRLEPGGLLPHSLAVCITKYDDPQVFERALSGGWAVANGAGVPVVPSARAEAFFDSLTCGQGQGEDLVRRAIRTNFDAAATRYFVTSAIGVRTGADGRIDLRDYSKVDSIQGRAQIRGEIQPINVLEPLVWLEQSVRSRI